MRPRTRVATRPLTRDAAANESRDEAADAGSLAGRAGEPRGTKWRPESALRSRAWAAARWVVAVGLAGSALLGLGRRGVLPGTNRFRTWLSDQRHARRIEGFAAEAGRVPEGAVVFLGSSTIEGFPFARLLSGAPCLNRGVGGDTTLGLLRRLDASLPVARPSGIVIYSGANDLRGFHLPPAEITRAMASVLDAIAARFSGVPVALVGTMPVCDPSPGDMEGLRASNEGLRALAAARGAAFVRTDRPPLADADGRLVRSMSVDGEHLVDAGYEVLARWILEDGGEATGRLHAAPAP